jgi:hypothetical protein
VAAIDAVQTVGLAVVIPTRNRAELAISALRSVLAENAPAVSIVVSDNSTVPEQVDRLSRFCSDLDAGQVRYIRPPQPQRMSDHWQWALDQARSQGMSTHFTYLTDRMVFRPGALRRLIEIAGRFPERVISYNHDLIDDYRRPVRLHEFRWTGRIVEIDSVYLLSLASLARHPPCNPRFLNCLVPASVVSATEARFGRTFGSISPDFHFAYRCLDIVDKILYWDRSALVNYASNRSNGAAQARGVASLDSADFEALIGAQPLNHATPVPEFRTITNAVLNEYCVARAESRSAKFPAIDMKSYLAAMAIDIEGIENTTLAAAQRDLLVSRGGVPLPRGSARIATRLRAGPARLVRLLTMRVFANSITQPTWAILGQLGMKPPPSQWFTFQSASEALEWTSRFPRRPSGELRRLDWLRDKVHVREVNTQRTPGRPVEIAEVGR